MKQENHSVMDARMACTGAATRVVGAVVSSKEHTKYSVHINKESEETNMTTMFKERSPV